MATLLALLVFGFIKGRFTGTRPFRSAIQTALIGGLAAAAAFLILPVLFQGRASGQTGGRSQRIKPVARKQRYRIIIHGQKYSTQEPATSSYVQYVILATLLASTHSSKMCPFCDCRAGHCDSDVNS